MTVTEIPEDFNLEPEISLNDFAAILLNERGYTVFYDIETRPADDKTLEELFANENVKLPAYPGIFDPMKVKYGNLKDKEKRQAKLNEAIAAHQQSLVDWEEKVRAAKEQAWLDFKANATLKPTTGRVLAIGYGLKRPGGVQLFLDVNPVHENDLLRRFWSVVRLTKKRHGKLVSFNGHSFDLPFMVRRSWAYEDVEPVMLLTKYRKYEDFCIDALEVYRQGGSWNESIKLDHLAQMMGVTRKLDGVTGDMFWQLYFGNDEDRERAMDYLALDIHSLAAVAERMRLV